MIRRTGWNTAALTAAAMLVAGGAHALSARNSAAKVRVEGLSPGVEYRFEGPPDRLAVTDTGQEPIVVGISLAPPGPGQLVDGYEPMPASWARLLTRRLRLSPGQTGAVAGRLSLPARVRDGPGQFQLDWISEARAQSGLTLRLVSKILVSAGDEDVIARAKARAPRTRAQYSIFSPQRSVRDVPLGRAVPLARLVGALKVANLGSGRAVLAVRSVDARDAWPGIPKGFVPSPNPRFIRPEKAVVEVPPDGVAELPLAFDVPDEPRYRARRWAFVVRVSDLGDAAALPQEFRILVVTQGGSR